MVDRGGFFVEEGGEWEEFGEVKADDVEEFLAGHRIKLVREIEKYRGSSGEEIVALW